MEFEKNQQVVSPFENAAFENAAFEMMLGTADIIGNTKNLEAARKMLRETYELRATGQLTEGGEHEIRRRLLFVIECN